jgi:4-diphosphocytidyl-2-C-methyl-D-erythritol kinase
MLALLRSTEAKQVRMSGSGATCFALYGREEQREQAASAIATAQPHWWQLQGRLR